MYLAPCDFFVAALVFFFGADLQPLTPVDSRSPGCGPKRHGERWGRSLSYGFPGRGRLTRGSSHEAMKLPLKENSARGRPWSQDPCGRPSTTGHLAGDFNEPRLDQWGQVPRPVGAHPRTLCLGVATGRLARKPAMLSLHWAPGVVHWVHHQVSDKRLVPRLAYLASRCRLGPGVSVDVA